MTNAEFLELWEQNKKFIGWAIRPFSKQFESSEVLSYQQLILFLAAKDYRAEKGSWIPYLKKRAKWFCLNELRGHGHLELTDITHSPNTLLFDLEVPQILKEKYLENLTLEELADRYDISVASAHNRIVRAIHSIRRANKISK